MSAENQSSPQNSPEGKKLKAHPLQTPWSFWYAKKPEIKRSGNYQVKVDYDQLLKNIGTISTIEDFYSHYVHLARPAAMREHESIHLFREGTKPMWEAFPKGGTWILVLDREEFSGILDRKWEALCISAIGEEFEEPGVSGVMLNIKRDEAVMTIWVNDNDIRFKVGEKIREVLNLAASDLTIYYKQFKDSLKDKSTLRNAEGYFFVATPKQNKTPTVEEAAKKNELEADEMDL
eukprot:CAMPEP_0114995560 /NCGR_PEP_ID=MMETSP0216-20121206/13801_1 /TAXON_ID=223996 /ORGANISM="Protocruzia adherens, Strain Boccale" /LENGTH=233 /DNA_ID=CAMNT_0002359623 /DNA_START=25 /DNA_END=726 /DNA_ORIENTATION=-